VPAVHVGRHAVGGKLDRLSRNVPFLRSLIDSSVDVAFCDLPHVPPGAMGRFLLTQMAAVAELEAGLTSERTKAALAAAKARGVKLGGDRGNRPAVPVDWRSGVKASTEARIRGADHAAHRLAPALEAARRALGADASLHAIARHLTETGVATPAAAPGPQQRYVGRHCASQPRGSGGGPCNGERSFAVTDLATFYGCDTTLG
jgi:DNA invertase Pin-like site-specific DNA recombinase